MAKMRKLYRHKKHTEKLAEIIEQNEDTVTLRDDSGVVSTVKIGTFKRWWKFDSERGMNTPKTFNPDLLYGNNVGETIRVLIEDEIKSFEDVELFHGKMANFYCVKYKGKNAINFTTNKKGIVLWMKSKYVGIPDSCRILNHTFNVRLNIDKVNTLDPMVFIIQSLDEIKNEFAVKEEKDKAKREKMYKEYSDKLFNNK